MKTKLPIFIATVSSIIISCKSPEQKRDEKLMPIIRQTVVSDSLAAKIDSIKIYKVDTLTALKDSLAKIEVLERLADRQLIFADNERELSTTYKQSMELSLSQAKLYRIIGSDYLVDDEIKSATRHKDDAIAANKRAMEHLEKSQKLRSRALKIITQRNSRKIDSTTFKGYMAYFKLIGADAKNNAVKLDSLFVMATPEYHLIRYTNINRK